MLRHEGEEGQGCADVAVEVAGGLEGVVPLGEDAGQELFEGGFAHAAGDLHHGDRKPAPVPPGQIPQGPLHDKIKT